jgi:hypothetical protein
MPPRCDRCDDPIGVYEPVVVIAGERVRDTSLARERTIATGAVCRHQACHAAAVGAASGDHAPS